MEVRFGPWDVSCLCGRDSLKTVASKLVKYKLDPVAVQNVRWVEGGSQPADDYTFYIQIEILITT
jgi:hypothetical protein